MYRDLSGKIGTTEGEIGTTHGKTDTRDWLSEIYAIKDLQKRQVELLLQLMEILSVENGLSYSDLAKRTEKSRSTIQQYMLYLSDNGYIRRIGDKYCGHWEVV